MRMALLLPQPLCPTMPRHSPAATAKSTPSSTRCRSAPLPKDFTSPSAFKIISTTHSTYNLGTAAISSFV